MPPSPAESEAANTTMDEAAVRTTVIATPNLSQTVLGLAGMLVNAENTWMESRSSTGETDALKEDLLVPFLPDLFRADDFSETLRGSMGAVMTILLKLSFACMGVSSFCVVPRFQAQQ